VITNREKAVESFKTILSWFNKGLLGANNGGGAQNFGFSCKYRDGEKRCSIGCLLTDEELDKIDAGVRGLANSNECGTIFHTLEINPGERFGFDVSVARRIQTSHDINFRENNAHVFKKYMEELIKETEGV